MGGPSVSMKTILLALSRQRPLMMKTVLLALSRERPVSPLGLLLDVGRSVVGRSVAPVSLGRRCCAESLGVRRASVAAILGDELA